ncbi:hypothetical protein JOQ06_004278 [Pogonophryne albipinna]|uniref:Methyltransferase domain-containing protein n=1 Tax=Pogonophryne albipinna TaxID=1090488 RepID=A0AAD6APJ1_9TELE|nr:hypothetical protein JOQ06_004278 [Pogonophryne albipinna]
MFCSEIKLTIRCSEIKLTIRCSEIKLTIRCSDVKLTIRCFVCSDQDSRFYVKTSQDHGGGWGSPVVYVTLVHAGRRQDDTDLDLLNYRAPHLAVDFLDANFPGAREEVQVLDVACGSGLVAKLMAELGFRHFVGVDCSKGMLDQAAKTGLYQDLRLALLGSDPLSAQTGVFDVVILVGGLGAGFAPVSVVRELCHAAKPGGFVCMAGGTEERFLSGTVYLYQKSIQ